MIILKSKFPLRCYFFSKQNERYSYRNRRFIRALEIKHFYLTICFFNSKLIFFFFFFYVYVIFMCRYIQCAQTRKSKLLRSFSQHWNFIINVWKCTLYRWIIFYSSQTFRPRKHFPFHIIFSFRFNEKFLSLFLHVHDLFANSRIFFVSIRLKFSRLSL